MVDIVYAYRVPTKPRCCCSAFTSSGPTWQYAVLIALGRCPVQFSECSDGFIGVVEHLQNTYNTSITLPATATSSRTPHEHLEHIQSTQHWECSGDQIGVLKVSGWFNACSGGVLCPVWLSIKMVSGKFSLCNCVKYTIKKSLVG